MLFGTTIHCDCHKQIGIAPERKTFCQQGLVEDVRHRCPLLGGNADISDAHTRPSLPGRTSSFLA